MRRSSTNSRSTGLSAWKRRQLEGPRIPRAGSHDAFSRLRPAPTLRRSRVGYARYDQIMSGVPADLPPGSAVVLTNPDEDASPEAFRAFIDELLAGPEPELESVDAAEALGALRVDVQA
jgi:hypothetical protein